MSISSEITRINTNIANSYTAVENKNGTLPQVQNSNNLASAIDSIQSSNIIGATAEGESISLVNTKAMPYNDYVVEGKSEQDGEPSPSNPSEIHSVADDVNLFDVESISSGYGNVSYEINNNHLIMTATGTTGAQYIKNFVKNVDSSKSYTLSFKTKKIVKETDEGSKISIWVYGSNDDSTYTALVNIVEDNPVEGQEYSKSSTVSGYKYYRFYIYNNVTTPVTVGEKTEYWDIKFQEGSVATPYSPYGKGTVTIKQRGKNEINLNRTLGTPSNASYDASNKRLFNYNNYIIGITSNNYYLTSKISSYNVQNNTIKVEVNGSGYGVGFPIKLKPNTSYILSYDTDLEANQNSGIGFYKSDGTYISNINSLLTDNYINFTTPSNCDFAVIIFRPPVNTELTYRNIQLEEGTTATPYEPYQANNFTFQTEPLRSLPNGVKDIIEADGIHRRVGKIVLDDAIELYEATIFGTQGKFASYGLQNVKNENRNYNFISDKLTYANEQFVKYGAYRNQTVLIVLTTIDDTLENFNSKISGSEVLYELAEEVIEPLTQNQATTMLDIIKTGSYEGTTNIYTDEDVKPTIEVDYYKYGETGGLPTVENEKLIFDKELQIDREELIF